jgi:O-succinylbenzoic acid--CoA ligase
VAGLNLLVPDWLRQRAALTPARTALIFEDQRWTFAELDMAVDGATAALLTRSVRAGDRVGIRAANSAGWVIAQHALMRVGAVVVPINTRLSDAEVDWQTQDAETSLTLEEDDLATLIGLRGRQHEREFQLEEWHSIVYTSGTTGRPKGAILTYGNHWWSAIASALNLGLRAEDAWLACLPLFHVGGLSIVLRSVVCGMTAVVQPRFDPLEVNRAIDEQGVSMVSVVSTMLDRMLRERGERAYPPSLLCVLLGGGPAPRPLLEQATRLEMPVVQTYGLTETASQLTTLSHDDAHLKRGSAGKPLMGSQVQIEADHEILVRGPTVSPGYLHQPPHQGWFRTGDLGYLDEDGYLYVQDRRADLIISGGENVYPAEVEAVLLGHPRVAEAGVIGVPDSEWGSTVAAVVVASAGQTVTAEELIGFCRQRLAGYKVPRRIEFRESLPHNAAGKLLRRELRFDG